ncbi:MAG: LysR family transcriptional regulator [Ilumatobacteraceae bacterium]
MAANLERLRLLHAVASHGSIAGAARAVGYTPSAVSQQLAALERDVSASLLERSNRGVTLTRSGELLSERASVILDLVDAAVDEAGHDGTPDAPSRIRIGAFPTAISALLLPALASLKGSIALTIVDVEPGQALAALLARDLDAAIVDRYDNQVDELPGSLEHRTLLVEPLRVIVGTRRRLPVRLTDLIEASWVLGAETSRLGRATRAICHAAGFDPRVLAETDDHRVAFDIVRGAGAVTMQPALTLSDSPRMVAAPIDLGCMRHIDFVVRSVPAPRPVGLPARSPLSFVAEVLASTAAARG